MIKSLFQRSGVYFFGLSFAKILSVLVFILFARALHPSVFGDLVLYTTLGQIATTLGDFGLNQWYQKKAHIEDRQKLFSKLINARFISMIVSLTIVFIFFRLVPTFSIEIVYIFLLSMIVDSFTSILDGYYFDKRQSFIVSMKTALRMVIFLAGYFLLLNNLNLLNIVAVYFIGAVVTLASFFPWKMLQVVKWEGWKTNLKVLKQSSSYALLTLTSFAYARGDSVVVKYALSSTALGIYGAAYRFLEGLALLPTAVQHNLFPESAKENNVTLKQVKKITLTMCVIGIIVGALLFGFADVLIRWTVGSNYLAAIPVLRIFSLVVVLFFASSPLNTVVLSSKKINQFLPYGVTNTVINLLLNILFVPIYGILAAAWVMFTTELTGLLINIWFVKKAYEN